MVKRFKYDEKEQSLGLNQIKKILEKFLHNYGFDKENVKNIVISIERHISLLKEWNRVHNLTSLKSDEEIYLKLVVDSLLFLCLLKREPMLFKNLSLIADFGSGAGFPGIVLAICLKDLNFTLIESNKKKVAFLKYLITVLNLNNVIVYSDRAEKYSDEIKVGIKKPFDAVLSKAAAKLPRLINIAKNLIRVGGVLIVWSKKKKAAELECNYEIYKKVGMKMTKRVNDLSNCVYPANINTEFLMFEKIF